MTSPHDPTASPHDPTASPSASATRHLLARLPPAPMPCPALLHRRDYRPPRATYTELSCCLCHTTSAVQLTGISLQDHAIGCAPFCCPRPSCLHGACSSCEVLVTPLYRFCGSCDRPHGWRSLRSSVCRQCTCPLDDPTARYEWRLDSWRLVTPTAAAAAAAAAAAVAAGGGGEGQERRRWAGASWRKVVKKEGGGVDLKVVRMWYDPGPGGGRVNAAALRTPSNPDPQEGILGG